MVSVPWIGKADLAEYGKGNERVLCNRIVSGMSRMFYLTATNIEIKIEELD
jgi:hypothetical protein